MTSTDPLCLAVDSGHTGALVLGTSTRALLIATWRPVGSGLGRRWEGSVAYRKATGTHTYRTERSMAGAWRVGIWLASEVGLFAMQAGHPLTFQVAAEDVYVGRDARGAVKMARFAGALLGPLEKFAPHGRATWYSADKWRTSVFRPKWVTLQAHELGLCASSRSAMTRAREEWTPVEGMGRDDIEKALKKRAKQLTVSRREAAKREAAQCVPPRLERFSDLLGRLGGPTEHAHDAGGVLLHHMSQG